MFFSGLTWFWTHVCSFCGILYILIGRYCSICGSVAFYIVFTKWRHRCTRYSIHTDWDHHRSGDNHLHLHISIIEERVRLEFTLCTNWSHFCTFVYSNIIPRYPNYSIPKLRIQYVDYISGTGVSDPDKVLETFCRFPPDIRPRDPILVILTGYHNWYDNNKTIWDERSTSEPLWGKRLDGYHIYM